ncbi:MAG: Smr/MutS family protein [Rikenellaceae bacterium]
MIYPKNFEQKIGFDRLREQVIAKCTTASGAAKVEAQLFSTSAKEIERRLTLCDEMRALLMMEQGFPSGDYADIDGVISKIGIEGSFLDVEEIVLLRRGLSAVGAIINFINAKAQNGEYESLKRRGEGVNSFPDIVAQIDNIVDRFNNIKDNASPELFAIRRQIREQESQLSKRLQQVLNAAKGAGYVDTDAQISIRDGRAVIPVVAGNKRKLQGFIHDESATGKTVYIEPVEVVQINNELKELEYAERREIVRILTTFTENIRPEKDSLAGASDYLSDIDMHRAKASWAIENECIKPIMSIDDRLVLTSARHPILAQSLRAQGKPIVPLDMQLDRTKHILVISGPNAGGKSVCLKTTGIVQYMFQCGFLVPTSENSELPIFESLYIDIGDEQSIDNDLSTYSSHLLNMRHMVAGASSRSLVLIDEFGSGTEPVIGGAIAEAILDRLLSKGSYGVITTHYSNIKYYASSTEGIANGAMTFDVQNIRPLFKLEMGKPGSSFAIEIARKIGLPEDIIKAASDKVGGDHINIEKQLREIARDKRYWEQKRDRIRQTDRKVEDLEQQYTEQLSKIRAERQEIIRKAKAEAKDLIAEANKQIESTIKTIREAQAEKELTRMARTEFNDFRSKVESADEIKDHSEDVAREMERLARRQQRREERKRQRNEAPEEVIEEVAPPKLEVTVGAKVRIEGQDTVGEVQSIKGKRVQVAFGHILTTANIDSLIVISKSEFKRATKLTAPRGKISVDISSRRLNFKDNIDVRGQRAADALEAVQNFVDDALMVGVSSVAILHGKGTGALKDEIRKYLRILPDVARAVDAHADRGGSGITVVEFNQ